MLFEDRARAESFGAGAALYDHARPTYPPALVDALLVDGSRRVLDVGCGTGIASALLAERGCAVLGVEVDARMAELARAKGIDVEIARFEQWDAGGRCFDLVISAQAWHWVEPRTGIAAAAAVLPVGRRIGLFWNFGAPPPHVDERLAAIYARLEPTLGNDSRGRRDARVATTLAGLTEALPFDVPEVLTFPWSKAYETGEWLEHLESHSDHAALPARRRQALLTALGEAIDAIGGSFEMTYETVLVSARRNSDFAIEFPR